MQEGINVLTEKDIETVEVGEICPRCQGKHGHHYQTCDAGKVSVTEVQDEVDRSDAQAVEGKPLSEEQIQEHFDTADKLFDGKKFEDGAVVSDERNPAEERDEIPPATCEQMEHAKPVGATGLYEADEESPTSAKLPPTAEELMGNDMIWLIAKVCHEVNRAYCAMVLSDHSHKSWEEAPAWQRESCYQGVLKHYDTPDFTPEDSHVAWCEYKMARGWEFGNMKSEEHRTHPNLVPYHQLHVHERAKDHLFSAVCKTMFGEAD